MSATATSPRRRTAGARPSRRISGPAAGRTRSAGAPRAAALPRESLALGERALAVVRGLPDHSLIDRLVRGRAWIPVLGVLLAGIVAMQVEILKLGASMGRSVQRTALLQTQNDSLRASVAGLADDQRIERLAAGMGMSMPRPEALVFLQAHPGGGLGRALADIHAPDPTGFASQLAAQAAAAAALMPPPPASTSPTSTTTTSGATSAAPTAATSTPTTTAPTVTAAPSVAATSAPAASQTAAPTGASGTATPSGSGGAGAVAPPGASQPAGTTGG